MQQGKAELIKDKSSIYAWSLSLVNHPAFISSIIGLIIFNAVIIGMETYPSLYHQYKDWFYYSERVLLWIFTVEIVIRVLASRPKRSFFKNGWNLFDFFIIASGHLLMGGYFVSVLRVLRILRVLRTITVIPSLQKMIMALLKTIPALGNIIFLMGLIFYIFAVMGTMFFKEIAPEYFGTLHMSFLTLFQVVTLESWASGVMRPILAEAPWSWAYFVAFILVGTFIVINLFIGVIVNNMQLAHEEMCKENTKDEMALLREEIAELKTLIIESQAKDLPSKGGQAPQV